MLHALGGEHCMSDHEPHPRDTVPASGSHTGTVGFAFKQSIAQPQLSSSTGANPESSETRSHFLTAPICGRGEVKQGVTRGGDMMCGEPLGFLGSSRGGTLVPRRGMLLRLACISLLADQSRIC